MVAQNFQRALRALVRRAPFRPFTVELVSGDRIEVDHPEALVYRAGVAVYISPEGIPAVFDRESVCQFVADSADKPNGKGRGRGKGS
jgi:hypothetical protein